jgi:hypothetical protein
LREVTDVYLFLGSGLNVKGKTLYVGSELQASGSRGGAGWCDRCAWSTRGAVYHVMARGQERGAIFRNDVNRNKIIGVRAEG